MPVPLCNLPSPVCTDVVTTVLSSSACSVTYLAAIQVISFTPFAPPLNVMSAEPSYKQRREDSSEDHLEMLATLEEVWAACKYSSQCLSEHRGPSSASSAVSSPAAPASGPSVPASGAGPLTPSSMSAAFSWSPTHGRSRSRRPSTGKRAGPNLSPLVPAPSHHLSWSQSRHPS